MIVKKVITNISKNTNENNAAEASNNDSEKSNNSGNGSNSGNSGNSSNDSNSELTQEEINKLCGYNYNNYSKIKLLHTKTGQVEEIPLDQYFEEEALKAQAVVARTYTLYSIEKSKKHENADVCDSPSCCQAWISKEDRLNKWEESKRIENWGKIFEAVNSTKGKVIKYNGDLIDAFFHSNRL